MCRFASRVLTGIVPLLLLAPALAYAADAPLLLRNPTVSASHIAFDFAGDLWLVPREGGQARRLTAANPGQARRPYFSPDGKWIAFTGTFDGNGDVYIIPAEGGQPVRLTSHPGADEVVGWHPDGRHVIFRSARQSIVPFERLFTIAPGEGLPTPINLPAAFSGSLSPDGGKLAYVPHQQWQAAWKRYRGGQTTPIWIATLADATIEKIPRDQSNDSTPMWVGDRVYFLSDREGSVSLFAYDTTSRKVSRVLQPGDLDIKSASEGPGAIVFERFGEIRLLDLATDADRKVGISIAPDLIDVRPRWLSVADRIGAAGISPTGARAVFEAHGDILTAPAEKGDVRNLTATPGVAERDPAWSPDGQKVAYFSDASGEYALHIRSQSGLGEVTKIALGDGPTFFYAPQWSPDGKKILFTDKRLSLWFVPVAGGPPVKVDQDYYETPERSLDPAWSPDGRWIAYTKQLPSHLHAVFAYDLETKKSWQLTDGMSDARYPVFDRDGKYLYFAASTDLGLAAGWLDMSSIDRAVTRSVYVAVLRRDLGSPLAPESDEEKAEDEKKAETKSEAPGPSGAAKKASGAAADAAKKTGAIVAEAATKETLPPTTIDIEGFAQRVLALPIPPRNYVGLRIGKPGQLFLLEAPLVDPTSDEPPSVTLQKFDLSKRKTEKFVEGIRNPAVAAKGEKLLYRQGESWFIVKTEEPPKPGDGALKLEGMQVLVDPRAEWRQMYSEVWRIQRDFLYDPNAHGLDLAKAAARYEPYVDALGSREDLNYLFEEMLGELTLGHVFVGGGDGRKPPKIRGGLLGADYAIENGRYRFARVFSGESWNPKLRAPLTQPGVNVVAGEYLLAVNGRDLVPPESLDTALANTAGRAVVLKVARDASGAGAREVTVVPLEDEDAIRNLAWVEGNRRTVDRLSEGRVAYVYLPDTARGGYTYFNRYFFAQVGKDGAVLDERFNGGGSLADYIIDYLRRPLMSRILTRDGADQNSPAAAIYGPKAMIINEMAGSGGDAMPWYFRKAGLGPLVGKRTWGGLVGIYDYPELIDGGRVTAPRVAIYGLEGDWEVENVGIAPDVEVELDPKLWREGRDAQLERAVALVLEALKRHPIPSYRRPAFPNYHKGQPPGGSSNKF